MDRSKPFDSTFFVLDFDRCIGNTDKARDILWAVIESEAGITVAEMQAAERAVDKKGFRFDMVEYVAKELLHRKSGKSWQMIREIYVDAAKTQDLLEPGARQLLDLLDAHDLPYGILTYGKESWQLAKLEAAGLIDRGVPFEITQIERKGQVLTPWRHGDEFIVPPAMIRGFRPLRVKHIVFLDDKPVSFEGIPEGVRGICVRPATSVLRPSQQGVVPDGVDEVAGIEGAIELLNLR